MDNNANIINAKAITLYPFEVVDGKIIACKLVKLACQRFINFLNNDEVYFDKQAVERVITFCGKLKHFSGVYQSRPFILENWQKFCFQYVYGLKWKNNNRRITRTFILSVGRKNGKSSLLSAMALYAMLEEAGASVVCAANSANQAKLLFDMCSKYLKSIDPKSKFFARYRDRIKFDKSNSEIKVVSADAQRLDGLNLNFFVQDETAAAVDSSVWDVLESSQGSRAQPLACSCSTRGYQLSGFYKSLEDSAIEVLRGLKKDDSLFPLIYTIDEEDNWKDESVWCKANPNLGVSVSIEYLRQQLTKALNNPTQERNIKTRIFNIWVSSSENWIPLDYIYSASFPINIEDFRNQYCYLSFDLASTTDLTCVSLMIEQDAKYYMKNWYFFPIGQLENNINAERYRRWANQGYLTLTNGNVTDYDLVMNKIMEIQNICPILQISYDQWNATDLAIRLTEQNLPLQPYSQSMQSMNLPTKTLERWILQGVVIIDKNPITLWCYENARVKSDWNENIRIVKNSQAQKIDGVIAMVMNVGGYLNNGNYDMSISGIAY